MFSIIAAIGKNRELGKDGKLLFRLPEDLKFFKETTMGHKVLMGRKTWESLPKKLPGRENIVISRSLPSTGDGNNQASKPDLVVKDLSSFIASNESSPDEIFIIGGGMLYWEMLKHSKKLYLTEVNSSADADTFFPEFDKAHYARSIIKEGSSHGLDYTISLYTLK